MQGVFERSEKKYLLSPARYRALLAAWAAHIEEDEFFRKTVVNIYYDTPNDRLIRASIDKPVYKEKLRLRSYGLPEADTEVYLELKKKVGGVVYKRRAAVCPVKAAPVRAGAPSKAAIKDKGKSEYSARRQVYCL